MYTKVMPLLTKGSFARYYGGCFLLKELEDKQGSAVSPTFMALSILLQISLIIFKVSEID